MLNGAGDTDGKVDLGANRLSRLTHLQILGFPAAVHHRAGAGYSAAHNLRKLFQNLKVLRAAHAAAAGYQHFGVHDIHGVGHGLYHFLDRHISVVGRKSGIELLDHCLRALNRLDLLHNAGTDGGHLGPVVRAGDGGDGVAAESRTGHQQLIVFLLLARNGVQREIADLQHGTVRSQTGSHSGGYGRTQITTDGCCAYQHDLRLVLIDNGRQRMGIGLGSVVFQLRVIHQDHLVGSILGQGIGQTSDIGTDQHCRHFCIQSRCQFLTFSK